MYQPQYCPELLEIPVSLSPYLIIFTLFILSFHSLQAQSLGERTRGGTTGIRPASSKIPGNISNSSSNSGAFPSSDTTLFGDTTATLGLQYHKETPDSILRQRVFMFHYRPTNVKIDQLWNPTLSPTGIHRPDILDELNGTYYLSKGTIGHPHVSIYPTLTDGLDMQLMPDPNIGYAKRPTNIWLYQVMTPYTVLSYNSSLNKDYLVRVAHTQNIQPGWNVSMDYRLISPQGVYTSSGAKNHYLDATTNYFSRDARLQAVAGIIWQDFRIDENGGISDDSYFSSLSQNNRAGIPVNLYNMSSLHKELSAFGHATYNFVRQFEGYRHRDSIVARTEKDSVLFDTIELVDTLRVGNPHVLNSGIIGVDVNYDRRKRVFLDSTLWRQLSATLFWTNDAYMDHRWRNPLKVTIGITPRIIKADIYGDDAELQSWLDPFARVQATVGRATLFGEADVRASFSDQGLPDSRLAATFLLPLDSAATSSVALTAVRQTKMPDLIMLHDASINQNLTLSSIKSELYNMQFRLRDIIDLDLKANHLGHNTWYDSVKLVREGTRDLWLYQATLTLRLALGWLHLDLQQMLQSSTDSIQMPVPLWASKNSVYADLPLFSRTVRAQIGADIHYHTTYHAPVYDPASGLFLHQTQTLVGNYIWGDIFVNLNIKRASFYLKAGHINTLWENPPTYFVLPHYPGRKFGLYWGITWHFFD